ncbi:MAG TPA: TIGR02757 family protein, partial [Candidatus Aminicenantes bacterium]|nr:TIGR02757 family protein [Candidatus Aminicenantes bacterium]
MEFLSHHYAKYESLEVAFCLDDAKDVKSRLSKFHHYFF